MNPRPSYEVWGLRAMRTVLRMVVVFCFAMVALGFWLEEPSGAALWVISAIVVMLPEDRATLLRLGSRALRKGSDLLYRWSILADR